MECYNSYRVLKRKWKVHFLSSSSSCSITTNCLNFANETAGTRTICVIKLYDLYTVYYNAHTQYNMKNSHIAGRL